MGAYYSLKGQYYSIHTVLASGGEGTVYSLVGHDDLVAKIYAPSTFKGNQDREKREKKLRAMLNMHIKINPDGVTRIAWPQDILYDTDDNLAGFTMPKVNAAYKIYDIYRGGKSAVRDQIYPDYTWKYSVQFAYHLAWIVDYLHSYNIVIADLNPHNIVVDTIANTIVLIDCDSFDITYDGEHFPCLVGLPEVLAPEIQPAGRVVNGLFSKQSDNFSLAVHIFRLLMNNEDPFGGVITTDESMSSIVADRAICNGECPYVRSVPGRSVPRRAPSLEMLPPEIRDLFQKTFNYTAITAIKNIPRRAEAKEWCLALAPYGAPDPNPRMKTCSVDPKHVYSAHNKECPWCKIEALESMDEKSQPDTRSSVALVSLFNNNTCMSGTFCSELSLSPSPSASIHAVPVILYLFGLLVPPPLFPFPPWLWFAFGSYSIIAVTSFEVTGSNPNASTDADVFTSLSFSSGNKSAFTFTSTSTVSPAAISTIFIVKFLFDELVTLPVESPLV